MDNTIFESSSILNVLGEDTFTPDISEEIEYADADDELCAIAEFITKNSSYNMEVDISRIKFLYTYNAKKEGGRYVAGVLTTRSVMEKVINDQYDYIISVYYPIWKLLDTVNKTIQLDKLLCGVSVSYKSDGTIKCAKAPQNSREYLNNIYCFGANRVIESSDLIHQTGCQIEEQVKEEKKNAKANNGDTVDFSKFIKEEENV